MLPNTTQLQNICIAYKINPLDPELIRSNSNLIYACGTKILRLTPSNVRSQVDIEKELEWTIFLRSMDLPVVEVLPAINGENYYISSRGENEVYYTAVCFGKIIGEVAEQADWNSTLFTKLGCLTGALHKASFSFSSKTDFMRWDEIPEHHHDDVLPKDNRKLFELYQKTVSQINLHVKSEANYGLVHYDIHQGNYLIDKAGKIILFDFEMTCQTWFINDIASVLYYACYHKNSADIPNFEQYFMDAFWKGYEVEFELDKKEREMIPAFLLYRDLMVYAFLHKIWDINKLDDGQNKYLDKIAKSIEVRTV